MQQKNSILRFFAHKTRRTDEFTPLRLDQEATNFRSPQYIALVRRSTSRSFAAVHRAKE
ncbi:hypothetical protein RYR38_003521 [Edwardsiella piscicida]|nr:hypothetical protein [Edwardsiella piscicida]